MWYGSYAREKKKQKRERYETNDNEGKGRPMLTNSTRYALIALRYFVWGWHNNVVLSSTDIADRYGMNVRALSPALLRLVTAGVLRSRRGGSKAGYVLARDPAEITMLDVLRPLEGAYHIDCCRNVLPGIRCTNSTEECRVCRVFGGILGDLRTRLSGVTLEEHASTEDFSGLATTGGGKSKKL